MKKRTAAVAIFLVFCISSAIIIALPPHENEETLYAISENGEKKFIKWVSFNVSYKALCQAYEIDLKSYGKDIHINFIDLLAYAACKNGGNFSEKTNPNITDLAQRLEKGEKLEDITAEMKYFDYYKEAYTAVLGGFVGEYQTEVDAENGDKKLELRYGIKAFLPIAAGYSFVHSSDFGVSRSYGFKRRHEGNDLFASTATPVVCVESGTAEELGWNRYGGWRIGIRSFDKKRYYYYAHLQKGHPYVSWISEGQTVNAGEVIGYVGMTGYSTKEDYNGMKKPHLHFGMQLIFDESQKDSAAQIWIDVYNIINFLEKNRSVVFKNPETGEFEKKYKVFPAPGTYTE